jgi:hypothetical protein
MEEQKRIFLGMFPNQWVTNFANYGKKASDETRQSIICYMNKPESLDPHQEDNHNTNQEDLEEDLKQGSEKDSNKDNSHPDENKDNNSFVADSEVSTTITTSNNTSHGNLNYNH